MPKLLEHLRLAALENEAVLLEARPVAERLARLEVQGAEALGQVAQALGYLGGHRGEKGAGGALSGSKRLVERPFGSNWRG